MALAGTALPGGRQLPGRAPVASDPIGTRRLRTAIQNKREPPFGAARWYQAVPRAMSAEPGDLRAYWADC